MFALATLACLLPHALSVASQPKPKPQSERWIADANGCRILELNPLPHESITWSGGCVNGLADGEGKLSWRLKEVPNGTYTGAMSAGELSGTGVLTYANGAHYEGGFYANQFDGQGAYTFPGGARFEGDFVEGLSTRHGHLVLTDGQRIESDFLSDRTHYSPEYRAPANLRMLCFPFDRDDHSRPMSRSPDYSECNGQSRRMDWRAPEIPAPPTLLAICFDDARRFQSVTVVQSSGHALYDSQAMRVARIRAIGAQRGIGEALPGCHMLGVVMGADETDYFFSEH